MNGERRRWPTLAEVLGSIAGAALVCFLAGALAGGAGDGDSTAWAVAAYGALGATVLGVAALLYGRGLGGWPAAVVAIGCAAPAFVALVAGFLSGCSDCFN